MKVGTVVCPNITNLATNPIIVNMGSHTTIEEIDEVGEVTWETGDDAVNTGYHHVIESGSAVNRHHHIPVNGGGQLEQLDISVVNLVNPGQHGIRAFGVEVDDNDDDVLANGGYQETAENDLQFNPAKGMSLLLTGKMLLTLSNSVLCFDVCKHDNSMQ